MKKTAHALPGRAVVPLPPGHDRPSASEVDQALLAAWQCADAGALPEAARQARLAVTAALVAGAPALSDAQRAMLDLLEGSALLLRGEHGAGLARLGSALGWFSPPDSLNLVASGQRPPALQGRTTPAWACAALGQALGQMGDPARGLAWVAYASALAAQQGLAAARLQAQGAQGQLLALLDQHLPAIDALQMAVSMASKTAPRPIQAGLLNLLAATWLARSRERQARGQAPLAREAAQQALACAGRALQAAQTGQVAPARPAALCHRAEARLLLCQAGSAVADQATAETDRVAAETDLVAAATDPGAAIDTRIDLLRVLAALRASQGRWAAARELLDQGWALAQDEADLALRGRLLAARRALERLQGDGESRAYWARQQQAHEAWRHQRRLQAAHQCARLLGAADLAGSGMPQDPRPGAATAGSPATPTIPSDLDPLAPAG